MARAKRPKKPKDSHDQPKPTSPRRAEHRSLLGALRPKTPEPPQTPDFDFVKIILVAVLSQILYGRGCFPARNFQMVAVEDLGKYGTIHDILDSGQPLHQINKSELLDRSKTPMLRHSSDTRLAQFFSILDTMLPLIDTKQLRKLRLPITSSKTWEDDALIEYWTIYFEYRPDGVCCLNVWRGGLERCAITEDVTRQCLWQVGCYVAQLSSLSRPFYMAQIFTSQARPDEARGTWNYIEVDFDAAKRKLVQRPGYAFERIASLDVSPMIEDTVLLEHETNNNELGLQLPLNNRRVPSPKLPADFPSTDELNAVDVDNMLPSRPLRKATPPRKSKRDRPLHNLKPPIETPPSDMEETQEVVISDFLLSHKRGLDDLSDSPMASQKRREVQAPDTLNTKSQVLEQTALPNQYPSMNRRSVRHRTSPGLSWDPAKSIGLKNAQDKQKARELLMPHMDRLAAIRREQLSQSDQSGDM